MPNLPPAAQEIGDRLERGNRAEDEARAWKREAVDRGATNQALRDDLQGDRERTEKFVSAIRIALAELDDDSPMFYPIVLAALREMEGK